MFREFSLFFDNSKLSQSAFDFKNHDEEYTVIGLLIYTNFGQVCFKFGDTASCVKVCNIGNRTAPSSISYRLHETFCGKVRKIMFDLIKIRKFN